MGGVAMDHALGRLGPHCPSGTHILVMLVMARHTDAKGRGCYASQQTLAVEAQLSRSTVKRCVDDLAKCGVIRPGDWRLTEKLRADHRPDVWDLALDLKGLTTGHGDPPPIDNASTINPLTAGQTISPRGVTVTPKSVKTKKGDALAQAHEETSSAPQKPCTLVQAPAGAGATPTRNPQPAAKIPKQRESVRDRDDTWKAQIAAADLDDIEDVLCGFPGTALHALHEWAITTAASDLGIDPHQPPPEDLNEPLARLTYLYLLKKLINEDRPELDDLLWPLDDTIEAAHGYRWENYCHTPDGMSNADYAAAQRAAVTDMTPLERGRQIADIKRLRGGVWFGCLEKARGLLGRKKLPAEMESVNYYAMLYAIDRYVSKGKWPTAVVPPSVRHLAKQSAPPPWAA